MSNIAIQGAATGTGVFTLASPATNTDRTLVLPDEAGTVLTTATAGVPIGGPAFSATKSTVQTVTSGVFTTVTYDTEQFDTNNNFSSNTFTPTVAGYYQINASVYASGTTITRLIANLIKNGSSFRFGTDVAQSTGGEARSLVSAVVFMNGTTDVLNVQALVIGTGTINIPNEIDNNSFNGCLVRSAT